MPAALGAGCRRKGLGVMGESGESGAGARWASQGGLSGWVGWAEAHGEPGGFFCFVFTFYFSNFALVFYLYAHLFLFYKIHTKAPNLM